VLTSDDVLAMQHLVRRIPVSEALVKAAVTLVRMTRPPEANALPFIKEYISWVRARASQYLVLGAKARAALDAGRWRTRTTFAPSRRRCSRTAS